MAKRSAFWKERSVLVTGGAGFIGFALVRHLISLGAKVTVLDIKKQVPEYATPTEKRAVSYERSSVTNGRVVRDILKRRKIRTVFHLAAEAIVGRANTHPVRALEANVRGTWVLLESARRVPVEEIIVASSDKAYGTHDRLPYTEGAALAGEHPYDVSKSCTDLIALMYAKTFKLPVAVARCGNVYGPGDLNWSRLIPDSFRSLATGKKILIRSDGSHVRDYIFVDDIVEAYCVLAESVRSGELVGEAFNFGTNKPIPVRKVLEAIGKAAGKPVPHTILNTAKHEIHAQYLDSSKAHKLLRWVPRVSRAEGFKRTATWYARFFPDN